jgi:hypothetical protein
VVRVRELKGAGVDNVKLRFPSTVTSVRNLTGAEEDIVAGNPLPLDKPSPAACSGPEISFSLKRFQPRTFAFALGSTGIRGGKHAAPAPPKWGQTVRVAVPQNILKFDLVPEEKLLSVNITDLRGRVVRELLHGNKQAETVRCVWDGTSKNGAAGAGVYLACVCTAKRTIARRVSFVK